MQKLFSFGGKPDHPRQQQPEAPPQNSGMRFGKMALIGGGAPLGRLLLGGAFKGSRDSGGGAEGGDKEGGEEGGDRGDGNVDSGYCGGDSSHGGGNSGYGHGKYSANCLAVSTARANGKRIEANAKQIGESLDGPD